MANVQYEQKVYYKIRSKTRLFQHRYSSRFAVLTLHYCADAKWVRRFKEGRQSIEDDERSGRPVSVTTQKKVVVVKKVDSRYTVEELAQVSGISSSSTYRILTEKLNLEKVCARWVPHILTLEQKENG